MLSSGSYVRAPGRQLWIRGLEMSGCENRGGVIDHRARCWSASDQAAAATARRGRLTGVGNQLICCFGWLLT